MTEIVWASSYRRSSNSILPRYEIRGSGSRTRSSRSRNLLKNVLANLRNDMDVGVDDFGDVVSDSVRENGGDLCGVQPIASCKPLRKAAGCCLEGSCK